MLRDGDFGRSDIERSPRMSETSNRRSFLKAAGAAGAALAAAPGTVRATAEGDGSVVLGFVGVGHVHTPGFVRLLNSRPDVRVKWVWDRQPERAKVRAAELEARVARDRDEVFSDAEVQGVVICSETDRHADLVAAAAKAGKHLFVEKPLGITAKGSLEMARAIDDAGLLFTTGYFMRTDPKHLFLKKQIDAGSFGKITRTSAWNCHAGSLKGWFDEKPGDPANTWRWMADPRVAGVGAFGDLGTHSLDILMWLFGDVKAVSADIKVVTGRYGDCDESGTSLMRFANGVTGTLTAGWVDVANPVTLLVSGTEGHATIVNDALYFQSAKVPGSDGKVPGTDLPPQPKAPLHQFVESIAGGDTGHLVTPAEAAARVVVMEAMYEAARSRSWVDVG
jgi:predicted dehydrogenase